jgi:hypothetical protein
MPIRIRCHDKMRASTQQPDISMVNTETMHFSKACYTAIEIVLECYADTYKQCWT